MSVSNGGPSSHNFEDGTRRWSCRLAGAVRELVVLILILIHLAATAGHSPTRSIDEDAKPVVVAADFGCDGAQVERPPNALKAAPPGNATHEPGQPIGSSLVFICAKGFEGWKGKLRNMYD